MTFDTGGGCYDSADPQGCGELDIGPVTDERVRSAVLHGVAQLAAVPLGPEGCGGEFVDGVSVRALVETEQASVATRWVVCLSDAPPDDPAAAALWRLYEEARAGS